MISAGATAGCVSCWAPSGPISTVLRDDRDQRHEEDRQQEAARGDERGEAGTRALGDTGARLH